MSDNAPPVADRRARPGGGLLLDRWRQHLPLASAALLPLLEEAASTGTEFPHAERALFMACDFWTAVATQRLLSHLGTEPVGKLRYMGIVYSAMGASDISGAVNQAANDLRGPVALQKDRLLTLESRLLTTTDSVDRLIARLVQAMIANSTACTEESETAPFKLMPVSPTTHRLAPQEAEQIADPAVACLIDPAAETPHDQLPSGMDYDLRRRLETFAEGHCSSEAFIQELAAQCEASPDFIWDVLALSDQYHRRGKISAEFQRSIRDLIERPALTQRRPQVVTAASKLIEQPAAGEAARLPGGTPESGIALTCTRVPAQSEVHQEQAPAPVSAPCYAPQWAANPEIIVPTLYELCGPVRDGQSASSGAPGPQVAAKFSSVASFRVKSDAPHQEAEEVESAMGRHSPRHVRQARLLQIGLLAALFSCVTASSALSSLSVATRSPPPVAASPATTESPLISLSSDRYIVHPGSRSAVIEVDRTGDTSTDVSFTWWTSSSGAKSGRDYRGSRPQTVRLPAGAKSLQWSIPILPNAERRHTELFYVSIGTPQAGTAVGSATRATVFLMSPD
jgi:hypothetical protein